jgi:hypothetical protein
VKVHVFVEGGGDHPETLRKCRIGFSKLFERAVGADNPKPKVEACGSRDEAYKDFCRFFLQDQSGTFAILLVDSEAPVAQGTTAWNHLLNRENTWRRPAGAHNEHAHLMVQCMESWFLADTPNLCDFYERKSKKRINRNALRCNPQIEDIAKEDVMDRLDRATKNVGGYHKTRNAFAILAAVDPAAVRQRSPHADALFEVLIAKLAL